MLSFFGRSNASRRIPISEEEFYQKCAVSYQIEEKKNVPIFVKFPKFLFTCR